MEANPREVYTSPHALGTVQVQITFPFGYGDHKGRSVVLEITDLVSGQIAARVQMTGEQFANALASSATEVCGATLAPAPHRLGRRSQSTSTVIPRNAQPGEAEAVRDAYLADGWEVAQIRPTDYGHKVVAYRWIEDTPEEQRQ